MIHMEPMRVWFYKWDNKIKLNYGERYKSLIETFQIDSKILMHLLNTGWYYWNDLCLTSVKGLFCVIIKISSSLKSSEQEMWKHPEPCTLPLSLSNGMLLTLTQMPSFTPHKRRRRRDVHINETAGSGVTKGVAKQAQCTHGQMLEMLQTARRLSQHSVVTERLCYSVLFLNEITCGWCSSPPDLFSLKKAPSIPPLLMLLGTQGLAFTSVANALSDMCVFGKWTSTEAYLKLCSLGAPGKMKSHHQKFNTSATNAAESVACQRRLSTLVGDVKHSAPASACATRSQRVSNFSLQYQQIMRT